MNLTCLFSLLLIALANGFTKNGKPSTFSKPDFLGGADSEVNFSELLK